MSILETSGFIGAPEFILGRRTTTISAADEIVLSASRAGMLR